MGGRFSVAQEIIELTKRKLSPMLRCSKNGPRTMRTKRSPYVHRLKEPVWGICSTGLVTEITKKCACEGHRWATHLSRINFLIEYINGIKNKFPDLLTIWSLGHRSRKAICVNIAFLYQNILTSSLRTGEMSLAEVITAQEKEEHRCQARKISKGAWIIKGRLWILTPVRGLKANVLVIVHCSNSGHRGKKAL